MNKNQRKSPFGMKIEIDTFIESKAKARPHVLMIMVLTSCLFLSYHTPAWKKMGYTVLALSVFPSVLLSVINIFRRTFLSNHASQPLQTW